MDVCIKLHSQLKKNSRFHSAKKATPAHDGVRKRPKHRVDVEMLHQSYENCNSEGTLGKMYVMK